MEHASPRTKRKLRCGDPNVHTFETADGVGLKLSHFSGGTKGPVILAPGFGTSSLAFTIDTTDTNFPEYLYENGYDVWVLDYRASPDLPSSDDQFTLDDIATKDWPAAVSTVRAITGADSVQVVAHCVGSLTFLMALASGLEGVRSGVASQLTFHPRGIPLTSLRAKLRLGNVLTALGIDTLTTDTTDLPGYWDDLYDKALQLYPDGREDCDRPFCRRVLFMYGEVYDHDQLNDATHDALPEMFGVANLTTLKQITLALNTGHVTDAEGNDVYLSHADRINIPIAFIHGEHNRLFTPEGSKETYDFLCETNGSENYVRHVIPGYAHMDCFLGKDAARDVYPFVTSQLDQHNPA